MEKEIKIKECICNKKCDEELSTKYISSFWIADRHFEDCPFYSSNTKKELNMNEETLRDLFEEYTVSSGIDTYGTASVTKEISDWWLTKFQEREAQLWQKMEEMKEVNRFHYNQGILKAQSLLSLPVNKE